MCAPHHPKLLYGLQISGDVCWIKLKILDNINGPGRKHLLGGACLSLFLFWFTLNLVQKVPVLNMLVLLIKAKVLIVELVFEAIDFGLDKVVHV